MTADEEAPLGLRERKKLQTRDALSWAVIRLSVERGWGNVTIPDAAAAAESPQPKALLLRPDTYVAWASSAARPDAGEIDALRTAAGRWFG